MRHGLRIASLAGLFLALANVGAACPTCRERLAAQDPALAAGLARSLAVMFGALLVVGGSFSFALWRRLRAE